MARRSTTERRDGVMALWVVSMACWHLAVVACAGDPELPMAGLDLEPPFLVDVEIEGGLTSLSPTGSLRLHFSEAIAPQSLQADGVVLVPFETRGPCRVALACPGGQCFAGRCQRDRVDRAWRADIAAPPLARSRRQQAVWLQQTLDASGKTLVVSPNSPLEALHLYTLLVGPQVQDLAHNPALARGDPPLVLQQIVATGGDELGRPVMQLVSPANDSVEQATNLDRVILRFSKSIENLDRGAFWLQDAQARRVALRPRAASSVCAGLEDRTPQGDGAGVMPSEQGNEVTKSEVGQGRCFEGHPAGPLAPLTEWTLGASPNLADEAGRLLWQVPLRRFATGSLADERPPQVLVAEAWRADGCVVVRVRTDEPTDLRAQAMGMGTPQAAADHAARLPSGAPLVGVSVAAMDHEVSLGGVATSRLDVQIAVRDLAGHFAPTQVVAVEPPPVASVVISEVLANPKGPEPQQEFVELFNRGKEPVSLEGWQIVPGSGGKSTYPAGAFAFPPAVLGRESYAIVVGSGYDAAATDDPAPAPGTLVIRLEGSIAGHGLTNRGAALLLRDAEGLVVAHYPGAQATQSPALEGHSVERIDPSSCGLAEDWRVSPGEPTPGDRPRMDSVDLSAQR